MSEIGSREKAVKGAEVPEAMDVEDVPLVHGPAPSETKNKKVNIIQGDEGLAHAPVDLVPNHLLLPGAFRDGPHSGVSDDTGTVFYDAPNTGDLQVEAHLVDDDHQMQSRRGNNAPDIPIVVANKTRMTDPTKMGVIAALVLALIVAIVVGMMLSNRKSADIGGGGNLSLLSFAPSAAMPSASPTNAPSMQPSEGPSLMPTVPLWILGQELDGMQELEYFGTSLELSSDGLTLAVGIPSYSRTGVYDAGAVQVFRFVSESWTQLGLDLVGNASDVQFGAGVALSGDGSTVAIAGGTEGSSPFVEIYRWQSTTWTRVGQFMNFGYGGAQESVCLSRNGQILAIGSPFNSTVSVFQYSNVTRAWTQLGQDITGRNLTGDNFGLSIDLSGDGMIVLAGAPGIAEGALVGGEQGVKGTPQTGYARVYKYSYVSNEWTAHGTDSLQGAMGDQTGFAVAISDDGSTVVVGAILNDANGENAGNVRVFKYSEDNKAWIQFGETMLGEDSLDNAGYSLDVSSDGSMIVIGAPGNKGRPRDDGNLVNFNAGHARVYSYSGGSWKQIGADIDGERARDNSGYDVAMSSDGSVVAVGARFNNGNALRDSGQVRVYYSPY